MSKVVLWVSDLKAQSGFYSQLFETKDVEIKEGFAEVCANENCVLLHELPAEYRASVPLAKALPAQSEVAIKPVFTVENIDSTVARIESSLASVVGERLVHGGFSYQDIVDPEGNVIQIQQKN